MTPKHPNLASTTSPTPSTLASSPNILLPKSRNFQFKQPKKKVSGLFRRILIEWNLFCLRLKSISEEVFVTDEAVEELFEEKDSDLSDRISRSNRGFNHTEEQFLHEFKKYNNLDEMCKAHQSIELDASSKETRTYRLDEVVNSTVGFSDIDFSKVRLELEARSVVSDTSSNTISEVNLGEQIWEVRRKKWLTPQAGENVRQKLEARWAISTIRDIPLDSYPKLYTQFVDKSKHLKENKKLLLHELIKVINAGWVAEERWQRAAKGLA